ncbi:hypothetical protein BDV96DRAFT_609910 [Lophiotrema nucula]|uniref:Zn(2)-C6 fungal-type domain-containing protein n=1 Tax=Lophiotrema nucula TaxID=690887 RepID=A0A6A5ZNN2_9PLEO|nr:hypothetical protein BDV96DRAFT_609910 [Lophiotrema nucula]
MADHANQQSRQPSNSYPSPHSYPSPSMQPTYTYPPPQGQGNPEPYRGSPQGSNMNLPPLNLPPIRVQDGQPQPPPPQQAGQPMGSPIPPQHGMPQYYPHPAHAQPGQPMNMNAGPHLAMRYQIPPTPNEQRLMSGGRHKKEIKRRTKTGCLTCRKRRIKCDEAHPVCRNCQKSKRECMGYDPIFKQQPGPAQIQPAPNSAPHQASVPASAPPTSSSYSGPVPQGYAPASAPGYAPAPPASHPPHENFGSAIDPALAAQDPAMHGGQPPYNGSHAINPALGGVGSASPYSSTASDAAPRKGKSIKIDDIFPIANHQPPAIPPRNGPVPSELDEDFSQIFAKDYCFGLDAILETKWFSTNNNALHKILADKSVHDEAVFFTEMVRYRSAQMEMGSIFSQEARLIWHMLGVCKQLPPATNGTNGTLPANAETEDMSLKEVRARFDILEALLTNKALDGNPVRHLSYPPDLSGPKKSEVEFWQELGNFVLHAEGNGPSSGPADYALSAMRNVLQAIEVRDAIYSIAIARYYGNRVRGFPNNLPPAIDDYPDNELNKLHVAMGFISYESRSGTQQVTARICDMAMLSWTVSRNPQTGI